MSTRPTAFSANKQYQLLPFRFVELPGHPQNILLTSEVGEFDFVDRNQLASLINNHQLPEQLADSLEARHIIARGDITVATRLLANKLRTKKSFLRGGPALHIFVVTLSCDHSCKYCQVSRSSSAAAHFTMSQETASKAVERLFESPARNLTVEFQGGEPLLAFERIKQIVEAIETRNSGEKRVNYTITSTLHHLSDEIIAFLQKHNFHLSTSLDGPEHIHNANRPLPTKDSHTKTIDGINRIKQSLGPTKINALTTLTSRSLEDPRAIIDEYVSLGFTSIFLRPLSHFGFAARAEQRLGYSSSDFVAFYDRALRYILDLNLAGVPIDEVYAGILLRSILTCYPTTYVDLRSPVGAGFGTFVYNYDGDVYASDEGRMLAEMGEFALKLGSVDQTYEALITSEAMQLIAASGLSEALPGCADCAFVSYCGPDPASSIARTNSSVDHKAFSQHCQRHMGLFQILFRYLRENDPSIMSIFRNCVYGAARNPGVAA